MSLLAAAPAAADHQTGEVTLQVIKRLDIAGDPTTQIGQVSGTGINCGSDCSEAYRLEQDCQFVGGGGNHNNGNTQCDTIYPSVSLSAPPGAPYTYSFTGWGGACSGTGTCEPFVDGAPTTVTADFTDMGSPQVSLDVTDGAYVRGTINLPATASDNDRVQKVQFTAQGGGLALGTVTEPPYVVSFDTTTVSDGSTLLGAIAYDRTDNSFSSSRGVTIDNTPPTVSWNTSTEGEATNDPTPTFSYSGADANGPAFACAVDAGSYGPCEGPRKRLRRGTGYFTTPPLADGPHTVHIRATDLAGNTATDSHSFTVDTDPPTVKITSGPKGRTADRTPTFKFNAPGESDPRFTCRLDAKPFGDCRSPKAYRKKLSFGKHSFEVYSFDPAGNPSVAAKRSFKIVR